jgi:signal transduction histidine kinase
MYEAVKHASNGGDAPVLKVSTCLQDGHYLVDVTDNGKGVPETIRDKIFQPFFTTKPTGEGTGLGLSMSYDIIKQHGGDLSLVSEEGKGATFRIRLPVIAAAATAV